MIRGSFIYIKHLLLKPLYAVILLLQGVGAVIILLLDSIDDIGRDEFREGNAGTYDYKQYNGLGTKKMYRKGVK